MPEKKEKKLEVAALRYQSGVDPAPKLVAHGRGMNAQKIMEIATEQGIPVREDPALVSVLGALEIGETIPADLYGVVAEVLAWAYKLNNDAAKR